MNFKNIAQIKLSYQPVIKSSMRPKVTTSEAAYQVFLDTWDRGKLDFIEQAKLMLLNGSKRVIGICELSTGGCASTAIDVKLVFATVLKANAAAFIIAHNHPSGNLVASKADQRLTAKLQQAAIFLDIDFIDHVIISSDGFYSFWIDGLMYENVNFDDKYL